MYITPIIQCCITNKTQVKGELIKASTDTLKGILILGIMLSHVILKSSYFYSSNIPNIFMRAILLFMGSLGSIGVAVFFLLSGYGNASSLKNCDCRWQIIKWFSKRIKKCIMVYLSCYIVISLTDIIITHQYYSLEKIIYEIFTLTIPYTTTWYLKVQVMLYFITFISLFLFKGKKKLVYFIFLLSMMYAILAKFMFQLDSYWWNTVICYSVGWFIQNNIKRIHILLINNIRKSIFILTSTGMVSLLLIIIMNNSFILQMLAYVLLAIVIVLIVDIVQSENYLWEKLGLISFEVYLIHIGLRPIAISHNYLTLNEVFIFLVASLMLSAIGYLVRGNVKRKLDKWIN